MPLSIEQAGNTDALSIEEGDDGFANVYAVGEARQFIEHLQFVVDQVGPGSAR